MTRKILLATGVHDDLPERPGFREFWGRGIFHCPYCHGWEVRDRPLAVLDSGEDAAERAALIRNWSRDLILLTDGPAKLEDEAREKLGVLGIPINEIPICPWRATGLGGFSTGSFSRMASRSRAKASSPAAPAPALRPRRSPGMRVRGGGAVTHRNQERSDDEGDHRAWCARGGRRRHDASRGHNGRCVRGFRSGLHQPLPDHGGGKGYRLRASGFSNKDLMPLFTSGSLFPQTAVRPPSRSSRCDSRASRRGTRHWLRASRPWAS